MSLTLLETIYETMKAASGGRKVVYFEFGGVKCGVCPGDTPRDVERRYDNRWEAEYGL